MRPLGDYGRLPDPALCKGPDDVGKLFHDEGTGIWYECTFDSRKKIYTWVILPPGEAGHGTDACWLHDWQRPG